jgi:hypothetical protein
MKISVGFTGTRKGMSERQKKKLVEIFKSIRDYGDEIIFHHGDCDGADCEADAIARKFDAEIHIHPPNNPKNRAFCFQEGDTRYPEKPYLVRDRDIVNAANIMLAAPKDHTREEFRGSGTWASYRYAKTRRHNYGSPEALHLLER